MKTIPITRDMAARLLKAIQERELNTDDFPELPILEVDFIEIPAEFQTLTPEERSFEMERLRAANE